ncbi:hypothetical protein QQ045_031245 [Rhodiola kirilowii]
MVISSNSAPQLITNITNTLGVKIVNKLTKYLGLPLQLNRRRCDTFAHIIDKMRNKVEGWKSNNLSIGGKEVLISAVLSAIKVGELYIILIY